jgi:hypothetical protein
MRALALDGFRLQVNPASTKDPKATTCNRSSGGRVDIGIGDGG